VSKLLVDSAASSAAGGDLLATVGVIARNEAEHILELLQSIAELEFDPARFEVVVVDGHSTDGTPEKIGEFARNHPHLTIRLIPETGSRGHGNARNLVLQNSRAPYVAFTDADCLVDPHWLASLLALMETARAQDDRVAAVGGVRTPAPTERWREDLLNSILETYLGSGGSAGFYKSGSRWVDSLGNYNAMYVRAVAARHLYRPIRVGEDFEFNQRLGRLGYKFLLSPAPVVYHHQEDSLTSFYRQMFSYGRGQAHVWRRYGPVRWFAPAMALFVLGFVFGGASYFLSRALFALYLLGYGAYFLLALFSAARLALRKRRPRMLLAAAVIPIQHAAYGLGFLRGFASSVPRRAHEPPAGSPSPSGG
jgi:glycosyltransferase involved in cell wall biosynthesis